MTLLVALLALAGRAAAAGSREVPQAGTAPGVPKPNGTPGRLRDLRRACPMARRRGLSP